MNGNVIRGPVIMTPLITDNYYSYRARGVISADPSRASVEEERERERERRKKQNQKINRKSEGWIRYSVAGVDCKERNHLIDTFSNTLYS